MRNKVSAIVNTNAVLVKKELLAGALLGGILITVFVLLSLSEQKFSPVHDELANIPSGLNLLTTGRYPDATHPPLLRYLFSIPQFIAGVDPLPQDATGINNWWEYGNNFLFQNRVPWQQILTDTRTVTILLSLLLLVLVFLWAKALWGRWAALVAVAFLAFEPNFLAHGQLATLDMGFALVFFFSAFAWWRYQVKPSWGNFMFLNLAMGIALMTKFSAISMFLSILLCIFAFRKKQELHWKRFFLSPFILLFMIWAVYLFQIKSPSEDMAVIVLKDNPAAQAKLDDLAANLGMTKVDMLAVKVPAYDFWKGFGMQTFHAMFQDLWRKKDSFQYLDGAYSQRGWRSYFVWTFLYKSTLATIALLLLLVFIAFKSFRSKPRSPDMVTFSLVAWPVVLFIMCSLGTINIGHRYILPVYTFMAMGMGFLVTKPEKWIKITVFALLLTHIISSCAVWPFHLSYFNELSRSKFVLTDSNIDWGQDLLYLKTDIEAPRATATSVWGDVFSMSEPSDLGLVLPPIPENGVEGLLPGHNTVYLSVNQYLNRNSIHPNGNYPWLNVLQPTRRVGTSILVFEINK